MIAFITGITGQDGSYLAELLLEKGYIVHGLVHRPDGVASSNIGHLVRDPELFGKRLHLHHGAFEDATHLRRLIVRTKPSEFYHLAAQSSPRLSLELPETTVDVIGMGTLRILEIIRDLDHPPRFLYASSSEVFGTPAHSPQDETTPLRPATPYGAAKALAQQMTGIYRSAYRLPTSCAILYNHESPRRSPSFVPMKVAQAVARISRGLQTHLVLGSLAGRRDWGWAPDYVRGLWLILQQSTADDFILATGHLHTVEELVHHAFTSAGLNWRDHVQYDASLVTAIEPIAPCGNPAKARNLLGWECTVTLPEIMARLVRSQLDKLA